jgi:uncharacterized protein (TIGR00369 family)
MSNDRVPESGASAADPAASGWSVYSESALTDLVGPLWQRTEDGVSRLGFVAREHHTNRRGVVHGGMLLMFADEAIGKAAYDANDKQPQATIQLDVQFIAPVEVGEFVEAYATVVRRTRSLIFMSGELLSGDKTVATASGIWKVIGR